MKKILKWTVIVIALVFGALQFVRPARTNPAIDETRTLEAHARVPADVSAILSRSCDDCHSDKTAWPWYSNVAPVSWFVTNHVNDGRRHMNFSDWARYDRQRAIGRFKDICSEVESGAMPLGSYTPMHANSELSTEDIKKLCDWSREESQRLSEQTNR